MCFSIELVHSFKPLLPLLRHLFSEVILRLKCINISKLFEIVVVPNSCSMGAFLSTSTCKSTDLWTSRPDGSPYFYACLSFNPSASASPFLPFHLLLFQKESIIPNQAGFQGRSDGAWRGSFLIGPISPQVSMFSVILRKYRGFYPPNVKNSILLGRRTLWWGRPTQTRGAAPPAKAGVLVFLEAIISSPEIALLIPHGCALHLLLSWMPHKANMTWKGKESLCRLTMGAGKPPQTPSCELLVTREQSRQPHPLGTFR